MYYTGYDPRDLKKVYTATSAHEKAMQRALIQYRRPENYDLVKEALVKTGRTDLIGYDHSRCLIPPRKPREKKPAQADRGPKGKGPAASAPKRTAKAPAGKPAKKASGTPKKSSR